MTNKVWIELKGEIYRKNTETKVKPPNSENQPNQ
jgi:hypothetical protein